MWGRTQFRTVSSKRCWFFSRVRCVIGLFLVCLMLPRLGHGSPRVPADGWWFGACWVSRGLWRFLNKVWTDGLRGLPWWLRGKESSCQCRRHRFDPWVRKVPWSSKWQTSPVFLPGKLHGQSLESYNPWGCKESDVTEHSLSFYVCIILATNIKPMILYY